MEQNVGEDKNICEDKRSKGYYYSYLLTLDEFVSSYKPELSHICSGAYEEYMLKINHLLALILVNKRLDTMEFTEHEMDYFKDVTGRYFTVEIAGKTNEEKSKAYFKEKLRDYGKQALSRYVIVQLISAVEVYFKRAFEEIFNDDIFLQCYLKDENPHSLYMKKFFVENGILEEFQKQYFLHGNKIESMGLGTIIISLKEKGISFQRKENIKSLLDIFFKSKNNERGDFLEIMIKRIGNSGEVEPKELRKYWDAFKGIADIRHDIIHGNGRTEELQDKLYKKLGFFILDINNIEQFILPAYIELVSLVDKRLFTYSAVPKDFDSRFICIESLGSL